jgi:hypothetical protein
MSSGSAAPPDEQQTVEQATVDVDHVATEVACQMDDCIQGRERG